MSSFQMFLLAKNVRFSRRTLVPVFQRLLSLNVLSGHKEIRTLECHNGEKVCVHVILVKRAICTLSLKCLFAIRYEI